jgi:hypothetical protein
MAFTLKKITTPAWNIFAAAFSKVYSPDSYDVPSGEFNYQTTEDITRIFFKDKKSIREYDFFHIEDIAPIKKYRWHPIILLTTFFGLPNQCELHEEITWEKIGKNLRGLQDGKNTIRTEFNNNILIQTLTVMKNLVFAVFKTMQNILKLATEFLPALISEIFFAIALPIFRLCREAWKDEQDFKTLLMTGILAIPFLIAAAGFTIAKIIQLAGRSITSPIDSVGAAWFTGRLINNLLKAFVSDHPAMKLLGYAAGFTLSLVSIAATTAAYMILFPLLISMTPALWIHITYFGSNFLLPLLLKIGIVMEPALESVAAIIGISTGLAVTTIGPVLLSIYNSFKNKWRLNDNAKMKIDHLTFDDPQEPIRDIQPEPSFNTRYTAEPGTPSNSGMFKLTPDEGESITHEDKELDSHVYSGRRNNLS